MTTMTPAEIVSELDKHIIGQGRAKKAVAVALRNRWRRQQVAEPLRQEITPKNILMIGPTGVGKTEIARRLAKLADAPFIKIEATKFTEVGYVGRDVDSIVRDLIEISVKQTRESEMKKVRTKAEDRAEDRILDILLPTARPVGFGASTAAEATRRQQQRHAPDFPQAPARRRARRQGSRTRCRDAASRHGHHGAAGHGRHDRADPLDVREYRRRQEDAPQGEGEGSAQAPDRRGSRQAAERRRGQDEGGAERRAERHRVPRRNRQDRVAQ